MADKLSFSVIGVITPDLRQLISEFEQIRHIKIELLSMSWERAWAKLLTYALQGEGPDISHVGSTWVSSLVAMNAVREFSPLEVETMGGAQAFTAPAWQSATLQDDPRVWSDAIDALDCEIKQLVPVLKKTFETGRAHKSLQLWTRSEQQLGRALDAITDDVISKNKLPADSILEIHLSELQHRFSLLIG